MKAFSIFACIAFLFVCALMFSTSSGSARPTPAAQKSEQASTTQPAPAIVVDFAIVQETGICNVADRVTETVARFTPSVIRIPEAPAKRIDHVPLV